MVEREGALDHGEGGFLGEGVEPGLTDGFRGDSGHCTGSLDGTKDEELFVEAEVDPFHHVGIREALDDDGFAAAVLVNDLERVAETRCGGGLSISHGLLSPSP